MKNGSKALIAAAGLFWAGSAGAVEVVNVSPAEWEQVSAASAGDLDQAAGNISAAIKSGDSARAGELLSGLFSGAASKASAAPVYASVRTAAAVPPASAPIVARPAAAVKGGFVPELMEAPGFLKSDFEIEPEEVDGDEAGSDDDEGGEDGSEASSAGADDSVVTPPSPLWETMAAGMAGILVVISFIALFPAAPLLLAVAAAALFVL